MTGAVIINKRLTKLRRQMRDERLPAVFVGIGEYVNGCNNRRYLTNFRGTTASILVTQRMAYFFTDFRYIEKASRDVPSCYKLTEVSDGVFKTVKKIMKQERLTKLGIEDRELTIAAYKILQSKFRSLKLSGIGGLIENLRITKDEREVADLRLACKETDQALSLLVKWLRSRRRAKRLPTEADVALKVSDIIHQKKLGELSFPTIVASGKHAARPHHEPTNKRLKFGETLIIDMGVKVNGYHADMTRTLHIGPWTSKHQAMYETCLKAQVAVFRYLKKGGRNAGETDKLARGIIDKKFPGSFGHSLGHGVGLDIHEAPTLASGSKHRLKNGMVFSVEPGVYLSGVGGIRIEDLVLLEGGEAIELSQSTKKIKKIVV